ncbi:M-phase phosphoprotein 6 [Nitzschia inconspicua]|uniref:M-phase phosphoprotein 6 n=1 Tax=Nitzschia inconspicua TaxID=303405 RepID=A0A9K3LC74_9STRA|nr:M-phase phosphoprotein 6 [Nitzschia inconspicua]
MWKPGSDRPSDPSRPPGQKRPPSRSPNPPLSGGTNSTPTTSASSTSPRKRLSGTTMNMKFMKRKKEMIQNEEKRKAAAEAIAASSNGESSVFAAPTPQQNQGPTPMDIDHNMNTDNSEAYLSANLDNNSQYAQVTTSVDMYGSQAALIGRRSFGGFNPAMERAYSDSKASVENRASDRPLQKISDEELLERYKESVMQRESDGRGVGNLDGKVKKRKRQGLR